MALITIPNQSLATTLTPTEFNQLLEATKDGTLEINTAGLRIGSTVITPTATEINYLSGVTSAVQTQLNAKSPIASPTFTGTVTVPATNFTVGASLPFSDSAGTLTLQNVDAIDATTETTIEAAIDTLANLTSIQGRTVNLADAGVDAILGWDDSANAYENLTQAEVLAVIGDALTTAKGVVELATDAETVTGTDAVRATTPANITAKLAAPGAIGGTTPSTAVFTTATINTGIIPDANDGAYLGTTTAQWSDLFLAEGGVINWDNGDATLTQVGDVVTLAGAELRTSTVGTDSTSVVTVGGTQTLTNKTLTSPALAGDLDAAGFDVKDISLGTFKFFDAGNSGTSKTIAWNNGAMQQLTLTGNLGTFTFTAPTIDAGNWVRLQLYVIQGAGPYTITWPTSVKFPGGTAPTLNTTSGNVDLITFLYNGTNYAAVASINHDM